VSPLPNKALERNRALHYLVGVRGDRCPLNAKPLAALSSGFGVSEKFSVCGRG
jgi:hypothetical protein